MQAGGKGINVARALKQLEEPVVATGLAGGANGTRIVEELAREGVLNDFVRIADESRRLDGRDRPDGRAPDGDQRVRPRDRPRRSSRCWRRRSATCRAARTPSCSRARCPGGCRRSGTRRSCASCGGARCRWCWTPRATRCAWRVAAEPDLVSPNQYEAEELVGHEFQGDADFIGALDEIADFGARNVIITRESGCFALLREGSQTLRFQVEVDLVEPVSSVGSGDALLAGYLASRAARQGARRGPAPRRGLRHGERAEPAARRSSTRARPRASRARRACARWPPRAPRSGRGTREAGPPRAPRCWPGRGSREAAPVRGDRYPSPSRATSLQEARAGSGNRDRAGQEGPAGLWIRRHRDRAVPPHARR